MNKSKSLLLVWIKIGNRVWKFLINFFSLIKMGLQVIFRNRGFKYIYFYENKMSYFCKLKL